MVQQLTLLIQESCSISQIIDIVGDSITQSVNGDDIFVHRFRDSTLLLSSQSNVLVHFIDALNVFADSRQELTDLP